MAPRAVPVLLAALALAAAARAGEPQISEGPPIEPVLRVSSGAITDAPPPPSTDLLVFKGATILNEYVYRALLKLPPDAVATPETARQVAATLAGFLRDAGYDLARVRAHPVGGQIEVVIDEGALDKIMLIGTGAITALRFRAALNLPLEVFNRPLFEVQIQRLARQFGLRGYRYELWPVHLIDADNATMLEGVEELRAMPLIRAARGYELRIFAQTDPWSSGFAPEIQLNGRVGLALGGRYKWRNLLQEGDRWQAHFRVGGALRGSLDPDKGSGLVNSWDYVSARWLSKPWGGSSRGLRMTIVPRAELWTLQRRDLMLERYRVGTVEIGPGFGSELTPSFSLFLSGGTQRRWVFDRVTAAGFADDPGRMADVAKVPNVSNRLFLRLNSQLVFNPEELRRDLRDGAELELSASKPWGGDMNASIRFDLSAKKFFALGWHELRLGARTSWAFGDVPFLDEIGLDDHMRLGFGLEQYSHRITSLSAEFRWSLLRDRVKVGAFADFGVWRHLPRDDANEGPDLAGATGGGLNLFLWDEVQVDAYYGVGWASTGYLKPGLWLQIKEAF